MYGGGGHVIGWKVRGGGSEMDLDILGANMKENCSAARVYIG